MPAAAATTPPLVAVVGPTAAGKSDLAVALARRLGGEVVNADSMQLYRGMDVGTAKLTAAERRGVPHHLLDVLDVVDPASVARFQRWARAAVEACHRRAVTPVLAGGSPLYVRAVLDRFEFPGTDPQLRAALEQVLADEGPQALHRRLAAADPVAAAAIQASNGRRVVRALEVVTLTGSPYAASLPRHEYAYDAGVRPVRLRTVQVGLDVPRDVLDRRIARRVDRMWAAGMVEEVRRLDRAGLRSGPTASRALGYAQVLRQLAGQCDERTAREQTVQGTRRLARRQQAWLRRDPRIVWLPHGEDDLVQRAVAAAAETG